jgi:hypothetical protein
MYATGASFFPNLYSNVIIPDNNCGQINVAWFLVLLLSTCTTLFRLLLPVLLMPDLTDNKKKSYND